MECELRACLDFETKKPLQIGFQNKIKLPLSGLFTSSFFDGSMQNGLAPKASHEILEVDSLLTVVFSSSSLHCPQPEVFALPESIQKINQTNKQMQVACTIKPRRTTRSIASTRYLIIILYDNTPAFPAGLAATFHGHDGNFGASSLSPIGAGQLHVVGEMPLPLLVLVSPVGPRLLPPLQITLPLSFIPWQQQQQ
jgi:hypothetical protein